MDAIYMALKRTGFKRSTTCKICKTAPVARVGAVVCGIECAVEYQAKLATNKLMAAVRKAKKDDAAKIDSLKTMGELKNAAQTAFNAYIRARDDLLPCICCGRWNKSESLTGGAWDAGHYRSRGSADHLRYNEDNVHKQLKNCNRYDSGNVVGYRNGLIERIGIDRLEALEQDQTIVKWSREMLIEIKDIYKLKLKQLKSA